MPTSEEEIRDAIARALDQTEAMAAREQALEELRSEGVIEDILSASDADADEIDVDGDDIEAELESIKNELED